MPTPESKFLALHVRGSEGLVLHCLLAQLKSPNLDLQELGLKLPASNEEQGLVYTGKYLDHIHYERLRDSTTEENDPIATKGASKMVPSALGVSFC